MNEDSVFERDCQIHQVAKETPWSAEETWQFALVIFLSCFQDGFSAFFSLFFFLCSFLSSSALLIISFCLSRPCWGLNPRPLECGDDDFAGLAPTKRATASGDTNLVGGREAPAWYIWVAGDIEVMTREK